MQITVPTRAAEAFPGSSKVDELELLCRWAHSNELGRIALGGERAGAPPWLRLALVESAEPEVADPSRGDFGNFLLYKTLARDLNGRVDIRCLPGGLACTTEVPSPDKEQRA